MKQRITQDSWMPCFDSLSMKKCWVGTALLVCLMAILLYGFSQVEFFLKSEVILIFLDFTSLANYMYYYRLYLTRDLLNQFTMFLGFMCLHPKLGCSWGFQTAKYTSDGTPRCIINVKIHQWPKQSFPSSPSFQRYPQDTLNESCSIQHELLFSFT